MSQQQKPATGPTDEDEVLVSLGGEERDTALTSEAGPVGRSHRKEATEQDGALDIPAPPADEPLRRPKGALVILRKSGGLVFRSAEVVVYRDGRVLTKQEGLGESRRRRTVRRLSASEVAKIVGLIEAAGLDETRFGGGSQSPDAFVYEIAALVGRRTRSQEVGAGSIPDALKPLIERLEELGLDEG